MFLVVALLAATAFAAEPVIVDLRTTFYAPDGSPLQSIRNVVTHRADGSWSRVMAEERDMITGIRPTYEFYDAQENILITADAELKMHAVGSRNPGPFAKFGYKDKFKPSELTPGPDMLGYKTVVHVAEDKKSKIYLAPALNWELVREESYSDGKLFVLSELVSVTKRTGSAEFFKVPEGSQEIQFNDLMEKREAIRGRKLVACDKQSKQ